MDAFQKSRLLHFLLLTVFCVDLSFANNIVSIPENIYDAAKQAVSASESAPFSKGVESALSNIRQTINSQEWEDRQVLMKKRVIGSLGLSDKQGDEATKGLSLNNDRLILFISSSIPLPTLRAYARDLAKINGVMVLLGGVNGLKRISPTLQFSAEILKKDSLCKGARCPMLPTPVFIDPILFEKYNISQVPALAYQEDLVLTTYCESPDQHPPPSSFVVYGDASLLGMTEELYRISKISDLKPIIQRLQPTT